MERDYVRKLVRQADMLNSLFTVLGIYMAYWFDVELDSLQYSSWICGWSAVSVLVYFMVGRKRPLCRRYWRYKEGYSLLGLIGCVLPCGSVLYTLAEGKRSNELLALLVVCKHCFQEVLQCCFDARNMENEQLIVPPAYDEA